MPTNLPILKSLLLGDALGAPFNGLRNGHIQQLLGADAEGFLSNPVLIPEKPDKNVLPGLHSGLGQAMLAMATVAEHPSGGDLTRVQAFLHRLKELAGDEEEELGPVRHVPLSWRRAMLRWKKTWAWEEEDFRCVGEMLQEGHGAVLAVAAVALWNADLDETLKLVECFHARPDSIFGALFVGEFFREQLTAPTEELEKIREQFDRVTKRIKERENRFYTERAKEWREIGWGKPAQSATMMFSAVPSLIREGDDDLAIRTILRTATEVDPAFQTSQPQHAHPAVSLPWCLYKVFAKKSPRRLVEEAMNRGGEASLCTALTAAFLRVRKSDESFPDEWYRGLLASDWIEKVGDEAVGEWIAWEQEKSAEEERLRVPLRKALDAERAELMEKGKLKKKTKLPPQEEAAFAPPPHLWLKPGEEDDPVNKRIIKEARGKKRIDWKEDRRRGEKERE